MDQSPVESLLATLDHPRADDIRRLRSKMLGMPAPWVESIKWNAPSFALNGVDLATFRIFPAPHFELILHLGAKKLAAPPDLRFAIPDLRHEWRDRTRCQIVIPQDSDMATVIQVVTQWVGVTEAFRR
jgi:hypothetical protein